MQVNRFNREAAGALDDPAVRGMTLREYVVKGGYGSDFVELYLIPMSSAVWSTPPEQMLQFPAHTLLRFFHNHGFLGMHTQHPWWTVDGGSREYVKRLIAPWEDRIRRGVGARNVVRTKGGAAVVTSAGSVEKFDHVVLATHADEAFSLLAAPTALESQILPAFRYQDNIATVHTDTRVMPKRRLAWASWNYELFGSEGESSEPATHYWMNNLQGVSDRENYFVSINRPDRIDPAKRLSSIRYSHPLFDLAATDAQRRLPELNRRARETTRTYFAGSYFRYGFHEDALLSAFQLSTELLGRSPWAEENAPLKKEAA
jgi:uncharacterized protein